MTNPSAPINTSNTTSTPTRRVAIVTGAAQGIGAAIAQRLARDGFDLALADLERSLPAVQGVIDGLEGGGKAIAVACDVRSKEDVDALVEKAAAELGRVDGESTLGVRGRLEEDMEGMEGMERGNPALGEDTALANAVTRKECEVWQLRGHAMPSFELWLLVSSPPFSLINEGHGLLHRGGPSPPIRDPRSSPHRDCYTSSERAPISIPC